MHIAIASVRRFPDDEPFAREQARSLAQLGCEVTVLAPAGAAWPIPADVEHRAISWHESPQQLADWLVASGADVLHVYDSRDATKAVASGVPTVVEIRSTPLRRAPSRHLALLRMMWRVRRADLVTSTNPTLVGRRRPASVLSLGGYAPWAAEARRSRAPADGLVLYQGTLAPARELPRLLQGVRIAARRLPGLHVVMAGPSRDAKELADHLRRERLTSVVDLVLDPLPADLTALMSQAMLSVAWIPNARGFAHQPALKILDAQAAGVPVLATDTPANRALLQLGGGTVVAGRPDLFAERLVSLVGGVVPLPRPVDPRQLVHRSWESIVRGFWLPRYRSISGRRG